LLEKIALQHSGRAAEGAQTARTFGATQIAGSSGLKRQGYRITPLYRSFCPFTQIIAAQYLACIPQPARTQFGNKVNGIVPVQGGHQDIKILRNSLTYAWKILYIIIILSISFPSENI
jgi:hypothetical protein